MHREAKGQLMNERTVVFKNEITCIPPNLEGVSEEGIKLVIEILNMLNKANYVVIEAEHILNLCKEALTYAPVVKFKEPEL